MRQQRTGKSHGGQGHGVPLSHGYAVKRRPPARLTDEHRAWIIARAAEHPDHSMRAIARIFFRTFAFDVAHETVRRTLINHHKES